MDLIWSTLGSATHVLAERAGVKDKNTIAEKRYFKKVKNWLFSAQIDNFELKRKILTDFKITSVWSVIGKPKEDWIAQLNCQKLLLEETEGLEVEKLQICGIIRDWNKNQAKVKDNYPNKQVKLIPIEIWPKEKTEELLNNRVSLLQSHEHTLDDDLPLCTDKERWKDSNVYAVMPKGKKRALKLFDNPIDAQIFSKQKENTYVEVREGIDKRCADGYCSVATFCNYWKEKYGQ